MQGPDDSLYYLKELQTKYPNERVVTQLIIKLEMLGRLLDEVTIELDELVEEGR